MQPWEQLLTLYTLTSVPILFSYISFVIDKGNSFNNQSYLRWWPFPLFWWSWWMIQQFYCKEELDASHPWGFKVLKHSCKTVTILWVCLISPISCWRVTHLFLFLQATMYYSPFNYCRQEYMSHLTFWCVVLSIFLMSCAVFWQTHSINDMY